MAVACLFFTALHTSVLGALLSFARVNWYAAYPSLDDQQLGGLIMWIPGGAEGLFQEMRNYLEAAGGAPDPQVVAELQARYGCTHVGPQIPIPGL